MSDSQTDATTGPADVCGGPADATVRTPGVRVSSSAAAVGPSHATARAALEGLAGGFGAPATGHGAELRWGLLYEALGGRHSGYVAAIELMYEGYLLHYRQSRALAPGRDDGETALLAGDSAYAEGLRVVAGRGDVGSVRLLARLMSACAFLRDEGSPFVHDDALWAYTVAAMVAIEGADGRAAQDAGADGAAMLFDEVDEAFRDGRGDQVAGLVAAAVARLGLADTHPLLDTLANEGS
ncbi:MAG TPA: hypothetical protein VLA35_06495 [Thermoleophilia bacterium]|nr:hypothetical protein [Thermoleophilia bacterium]